MTHFIVGLFFDLYLSKPEQTFFREGNCIIIASMASVYCLQQMLLGVIEDSRTSSWRNFFYGSCSSRFDITVHGM
jgi:hypothetical protein